jgi:hypothetical protein
MDTPPPRKLLDQVRDVLRLKHYAYSTEESYVQWIRRFILFHNKCHPKEMGSPEIEQFLTYLAVEQTYLARSRIACLSSSLIGILSSKHRVDMSKNAIQLSDRVQFSNFVRS